MKKFEISALAESKANGDNGKEDDPYDDSAFKSSPFIPYVSDHESKIIRMMEETLQDRDVCYFYLESTNWDIAEATKLLKMSDWDKSAMTTWRGGIPEKHTFSYYSDQGSVSPVTFFLMYFPRQSYPLTICMEGFTNQDILYEL